MLRRLATFTVALAAVSVQAQEGWNLFHRIELRSNFRSSRHERFQLRTLLPPEFLPPGESFPAMETVDRGSHLELSVLQLQLDAGYGKWISARARIHVQDKYRRNPTSEDRTIDADELFIRIGEKPEFLDRPERTSFFVQVGKAPKMERQPTRLLESYGVASTSFNRFEDVQLLTGGTVGRNLYWRLQLANGNPLFFRDANALAGDNGTSELLRPNPSPRLKSGFPILYNAEVEGYAFNQNRLQFGQAVGYRWQRDDQSLGYDLIAFHYRRTLEDEADLAGTFYGGDLDLLDGAFGISLPIRGRLKEEYGARLYAEWRSLTAIAQFTKQHLAGLQREGWELEAGYRFPLTAGPRARGGETLLQSIQPAVRVSGLTNRFRGPRTYMAPSVWWPWTKIDVGVRIGFIRNTDLTIEHAKHNIGAPVKLDTSETLLTLRVRV
ncbi:MAG TPA: hypothetical protein VFL80_07905 [Thermoanaerobaculia bacterium]|nr:hypothetical protein [Thermoanaerobaculia bacterium]